MDVYKGELPDGAAARCDPVNASARCGRIGLEPRHRLPVLSAVRGCCRVGVDHLGIGAPINGDRIYNGAMDDASGVAAVLDIAHRLKTGPTRPRRSILFVIVTAEEKGLLGSHYYARLPTVPKGSIVADLNFDMPLPLWPLTSVIAQGEAESTLGAAAEGRRRRGRARMAADEPISAGRG